MAPIRRNQLTILPSCLLSQGSGRGPRRASERLPPFLLTRKTQTFSSEAPETFCRAVELWAQIRPPQPSPLDLRTGEQVHRLFSHRGRGISPAYINKVVIPLLCLEQPCRWMTLAGEAKANLLRLTQEIPLKRR